MSYTLVLIEDGKAELRWPILKTRGADFDESRYNQILERLKNKTTKGFIRSIVVARKTEWPDWFPDPVATAKSMIDAAMGKPMIGYVFLMDENGNLIKTDGSLGKEIHHD